jgi:DNA invertase Pin-like site-specific DNA recombinase
MKSAIANIRVSTQKQGRSGLGLEAQQAAIASFAAAEGLAISETFVEVETGKGADALETRPQLAAALDAAAKIKGPVIVAKLDRLTRDVHFGSGLMSRKVAFKVADLPNADNFQLHLFLALAEKERELISTRTKAALAAARERGTKLGSPTSPALQRDRSIAFAEGLRAVVAPIAHLSSRAIAAELNSRGIKTATGGEWLSVTVLRMIERLNLEVTA